MEGLDKGGQGPTSGCCAIEEEEEEDIRSRDTVDGIVTTYGMDDKGVGIPVPVEPRPILEYTQPPIQWVPGALTPGVKRPEREADHSLPASVEVKKVWLYTSIPLYAFMA
jgi:hypothetical protein